MKKLIFLALLMITVHQGVNAQNLQTKNGLYCTASGEPYSGSYVAYASNGTKTSSFEILNGKANGIVHYFYENGSVMETGFFVDNEKDGQWLRFDPSGKKIGEAFYKLGKKDGTWFVWDSKGTKRYEMNYSNGEKTGKWTMWDENGNIQSEKMIGSL